MKTIKMPQKLAEKWLNALRSDYYKQGQGWLECNGRYCCMGVLQKVSEGSVEDRGIPSSDFWEKHNICFTEESKSEYQPCVYYNGSREVLSELNDVEELSFKEIADVLEQSIEFLPEEGEER